MNFQSTRPFQDRQLMAAGNVIRMLAKPMRVITVFHILRGA
jgi:hypothetical protein